MTSISPSAGPVRGFDGSVVAGMGPAAEGRRAEVATVGSGVHYTLGVDWITLCAFVAAVYTLGLFRAKPDVPHPAYRWLAFNAGLIALLIAYDTPLDAYDNFSFFAHTAQHLLLLFVVAPLIAMGAPIRVALSGPPCEYGTAYFFRCFAAVRFPN